jgi:hypothetical protein
MHNTGNISSKSEARRLSHVVLLDFVAFSDIMHTSCYPEIDVGTNSVNTLFTMEIITRSAFRISFT